MTTNTVPSADLFDLSGEWIDDSPIYLHPNGEEDDATWRVVVQLEPDYDHSVFDDEFYGQLEWSEFNDYGAVRPDGFDGRARNIHTRDGVIWWQPPDDLADEHLDKAHRTISDLLEFGFVGVCVDVQELTPNRVGASWVTVGGASLWGIESTAGQDYFETVANDLIAEALAEVPTGEPNG